METRSEEVPHGHKRRAEDELTNDQRLIKRFNLLNLDRNGKFYIPVDRNAPTHPQRHDVNDDTMQLDNTKDKVYVYNLDDELRDVDEEDEKLIFLPDIERKFTKIPKSLLTSTSPPLANQEMVLYSVPASLTVPQEQDNVRKAIIETRERARQKQADDVKTAVLDDKTDTCATSRGDGGHNIEEVRYVENDEDAMDIG